MKPHALSLLAGGLLAAAGLLLWTRDAAAATIKVATLADAGAGSLRQAIADAAPGDSIAFAVSGTIVLTGGALTIDKDVAIAGPGASVLSISGNLAQPVFIVRAGEVSISGLTVRDGRSDQGAGVFNNATLTLADCVFSGHRAFSGAAIENTGSLAMYRCLFTKNHTDVHGAGIENAGAVRIVDSTFQDNDADSGGGIFNVGSATVSGTTLAHNLAFALGGAIRNADHATLSITNTTLSGNDAVNGGGIFNSGTLTMASSTVTGNTGLVGDGILNTGATTLRHVIIANNRPDENCSGAVTSAGYNLDSGTSCGLNGPGDRSGTDPLLGPIGDHGGPTPTHDLLPGSPAIDAGDPAGCTDTAGAPLFRDQRGYTRSADGDGNGTAVCDIGAYEVGAVPLPDADDDGVVDSADNCPTVFNPDQADRDGDRVGDACDNCVDVVNPAQTDANGNGIGDLCDGTATSAFTLSRVQLTADTSGRGRGRISISGTLDATPAGGASAFLSTLHAGCAVNVGGAGLSVSENITFPSCASPRRCSGTGNATARFTVRSGNLVRVSVTAPGRAFPPPLASAPATVTLSTAGTDQQSATPGCNVRGRRSQTAVCK